MNKRQLTIIGIVLIAAVVLFAVTTFRQQAQDDTKKKKTNNALVLDYDAQLQKTLSKESRNKNKLFDSKKSFAPLKQIAELPPDVEPLPINSHWWIGLSALPIEQSSVVVIGTVIKSEANLSDDKTRLYSEFFVDVEQVFKSNDKTIDSNSVLSGTRLGGSVRFRSGRVHHYRTNEQGMPQENERYLFFLNSLESNVFSIVTGYRLSEGGVIPLDGEGHDSPDFDLPFAKYRKAEESRLIQDLQTVLEDSRRRGDNQ